MEGRRPGACWHGNVDAPATAPSGELGAPGASPKADISPWRRTPRGPLTLSRTLISSGSAFEAEIGYSRAVVQGDWVFVSGTTGFDYAAMTIADSLEEQTEQCFRNIEAALEQAGVRLRDVVRVTYVLPRAEDFPRCWPILRKYLGEIRPAAMMISAALSDPRMQIEIEATALKGSG